jgi:hypothetical protein
MGENLTGELSVKGAKNIHELSVLSAMVGGAKATGRQWVGVEMGAKVGQKHYQRTLSAEQNRTKCEINKYVSIVSEKGRWEVNEKRRERKSDWDYDE